MRFQLYYIASEVIRKLTGRLDVSPFGEYAHGRRIIDHRQSLLNNEREKQ